jgi:hypothetical protein
VSKMRNTMLALALVGITATGSLQAQMQSMSYTPSKPTSLQITGGMIIPVFSYADFTTDIGWQAQAALVVRRGAFNHIRIEGQYSDVGFESSGISGSSKVYGGGIGGGRVLTRGNIQQEGYLVLGAYEFDGAATIGGSTTAHKELQFGTKVGVNSVIGRGGRVSPVIDIHWLTTWSSPYVNTIFIGGGLRF